MKHLEHDLFWMQEKLHSVRFSGVGDQTSQLALLPHLPSLLSNCTPREGLTRVVVEYEDDPSELMSVPVCIPTAARGALRCRGLVCPFRIAEKTVSQCCCRRESLAHSDDLMPKNDSEGTNAIPTRPSRGISAAKRNPWESLPPITLSFVTNDSCYPSASVSESTDSPAMFCPNFLTLTKPDYLVLPLRHNYQSPALCMPTLKLL